jgi:hypothetical protein
MYLDRIKSFQASVNKGENIGDIGTILDHVPFVSEIKGKNDELIQKFSRKDKKYVSNTHIFGQGA